MSNKTVVDRKSFSYLLPDPGGEVVRECLAELDSMIADLDLLHRALERLADRYERDVPKAKRPMDGFGALSQARTALREAGDEEATAHLIAATPDLLAERDKLLEIIAELIWVDDTIDGFADDEPLWDDMVELDRRQKAVWEVARKELREAKECN